MPVIHRITRKNLVAAIAAERDRNVLSDKPRQQKSRNQRTVGYWFIKPQTDFRNQVGGFFDAGVPVAPPRGEQVVHVAAMTRQLHAIDGETSAIQAFAEQAHFHRRARQPVNEQHAAAPTLEEKLGLLDHAVAPCMAGCRKLAVPCLSQHACRPRFLQSFAGVCALLGDLAVSKRTMTRCPMRRFCG